MVGGLGDPLETEEEIAVWPYEQMVYAQPKNSLGEWDTEWKIWKSEESKPFRLQNYWDRREYKECREDFRRLAVIQDPVKDNQVIKKTSQGVKQ